MLLCAHFTDGNTELQGHTRRRCVVPSTHHTQLPSEGRVWTGKSQLYEQEEAFGQVGEAQGFLETESLKQQKGQAS